MASNLKVDIIKPTATNGSLSLKGDSGGSATTNGISVDSSGNTSITGTITGTTTIATADINGGNIDGTTIGASSAAAGSFTSVDATSASLDGAVTINDSGADVDFRVESDTNENALFVEGSSGDVGIGTNSPAVKLEISGNNNSAPSNTLRFTDTNVALSVDQQLGKIEFYTSDTSGSGARVTSYVGAFAQDQVSGTYLSFATAIFNQNATERMRIDASGNVKINNLSASSDVQTDASKNLITTSDARLKNEIGLIDEPAIEVIKQIIPKYFSWKNDENNNQQLGFFAQDIYPVLPEAAPRSLKYTEVGRDENGEPILEQVFDENGDPDYEWGFTDRPIIAMCVKAIQEQQTIIESQQAQIDALSARLDALENPTA